MSALHKQIWFDLPEGMTIRIKYYNFICLYLECFYVVHVQKRSGTTKSIKITESTLQEVFDRGTEWVNTHRPGASIPDDYPFPTWAEILERLNLREKTYTLKILEEKF